MKRRTSQALVGIWTGFARPPVEGAALVRRELEKAHDYYNQIVQLELDRRTLYRAARGTVGETLTALQAEMDALNEKITAEVGGLRAVRQAARTRVEDPAASARIKAVKEERRALAERLKAARAEAEKVYGPGNEELSQRSARLAEGNTASRIREKTNRAALEEMLTEPEWADEWKMVARINHDANEVKKQIRAACGLTPGTYLLVEKAVEAAFAPPPKGRPPRPDPRPKERFIGEGRLGVQVHRLPVADLLAGRNGQIALRMSDRLPNGAKAAQRYGTLRMRVTTDGQYAEFPVKLHRPLPQDGFITQIWIRAERQGPRTLYSLQCVVESPQWAKPGPVEGAGTIAIDTGWRVMDGGIRVAYWMDDHGRHGQLLVPEGVRKAIDYADVLRGRADDHFNAACAELRAWMVANPGHVPAWMQAATATMPYWRAHGNLIRVARRLGADHGLWKQWRIDRKAAGLDLFGTFAEVSAWLQQRHAATTAPVHPLMQIAVYLEWWRRKDAHLYDWEIRERRYAENARTEMFRKVCQVARQYEHVLVEKIDLPKFAKNASAEEKVNRDWLHRVARIASPGDLAARLMETCKGQAEKMAPHNNTRTCHKCGHVNNAWERQADRVQTCAGCAASWDQDENACRVMLALWHGHAPGGERERSGDAPTTAPARSAENKPARSGEVADRQPTGSSDLGRPRDRSQGGRQGPERIAGPG